MLEPRRAVRLALAQMEAVRNALGDDIEICFDVHTRLDLPDAVQLGLGGGSVLAVPMEDPLRSENTHSYHRWRREDTKAILLASSSLARGSFAN